MGEKKKKKQRFLEYENEMLNRIIREKDTVISKYKMLIDVNYKITKSLEKKRVLKDVLEQSRILMECTHSSILLIDPATNCLKFEVVTNEEEMKVLDSIRLGKGEGIAGSVWEAGNTVIIDDVKKDIRFSGKVDEKTKITTSSIIATPLRVGDTVIGVMEAINKMNGTFNTFDKEIFEHLSVQAAVAIENARLYEMAITDGMTKLFIHRYFEQRLEGEFSRAERYKKDLSLVMFDIDLFKRFNDNYGHQTGDEILIKTAAIIRENSRASDIPCRYGGEEFCVILPETDLNGAQIFAEKIRSKVEAMQLLCSGEIVHTTISGGIASIREHKCFTNLELLKKADIALYYSKNNGRNRITLFDPSFEKTEKKRL